MEDIYYLIHTTNNPDCVNWTELRTNEFNTDDQFPGVYLSIITKNNIYNEKLFPGKYILIFSKKLLLQKNYHINFTDYNGIISEKNTYFPWNLEKFINQSKYSTGEIRTLNEVVFHDNIDMKYCCSIVGVFKRSLNIRMNYFLPNMTMETDEEPDMTKQPFYCYPFEDMYTGDEPLPPSSNKWYKMMARVCNVNINEDDTNENIVSMIREKAEELYNNREEQNIQLLQDYMSGGKYRRKTKTKHKVKKHNTYRNKKYYIKEL